MAEVIVTLKVMPTGSDVDLDRMETEIKQAIRADRMSREPVAFGLVSLKVIKIIPDEGGELDKIESAIKRLDGVNSVEVTDVTKTL